MSATMSHAVALPVHWLIWSATCTMRGVLIGGGLRGRWSKKRHHAGAPRGAVRIVASGLLGRCGRRRAEVALIRHAAADVVVHVPLHGALGERALRGHDLLEQRILRGLLLHDLVVDLE